MEHDGTSETGRDDAGPADDLDPTLSLGSQAGAAAVPPSPAGVELRAGDRIDHYIIRERLGAGGFAIVYLADQVEPVRRRVALKIIRPGMDSREVIGRFEAERQALALMDHPNVAKVFDAGTTGVGRPYFVMELVQGVPITEHCQRHRLDVEARLRLFIRVCQAVQHAHQKGIIHRDLKPSNILVTAQGEESVPKVIDFGIAKALHQRLTQQTVYTAQGHFIGTPEYMSPEQAEMTAQDVDTRSDIYSLGVILYELLTGQLPFDPETLRKAPLGEIQRMIREDDPQRPSTRLSSVARSSGRDRRGPRAEVDSLVRELRGDLDWIVMKAMDKDRTRRYETANGLALDVRRHLDDEPVIAGPPSGVYRFRKFVRRHRAGVVTAAITAVMLAVATAVSLWFAVREAEQRRIATAEATRADSEREIARTIIEFLTRDLLSAVAPSSLVFRPPPR